MKIYVMTKADETVAILDNSLSGALHYFDDEFHRYLETGASTFDLSIAKKHMLYSNASTGAEDDFQYLKENHFLIFTYKNRDYKFTIRRVEETETSLRLFCEDLSFDLLNEYRGAYKADKAYPISKYVNDCLYDSGYEIGINEFTKNERTLEWEGDQTVLKRLLSICNSFSAEIEFETVLNDDRTVNKQLVHLRKQVGMDRPDIELKYGRDVSSIHRNVDVTELITGIKPRGHEEDNKVVTIKNVEKEIKDDDGNVIFFTKKGSEFIYAPMSNQEYGYPEKKHGGYIVGQFSYDTKSDTELFNRALAELEKKCVPAYEFEIEGFYDIDIGDTIRAIDEGYNPILLLEARISEQTISFSDPTKNKTVYSNYRILENKVSKSLLDRIDEVKKYAEQVAKTYIFSINNVGSPMFKNGEGEVIFTAKIEKNNQDMTGEFTEFNWIKQKKDGSLDTIWNEAHKNFGKALTVKPEDFEDTATFSYEALQEGLSIGGASGVVTKVFDGEDGKTPIKGVDYFDGQDGTDGLSAYLHIRYSQNANGNPMTENPANAKYIGVQASQNPNPSTVPADYMWAEFKGQDGIPGETGADGKTSYLHIKYSNDGGKTFTGNSGEDAGDWIGQYVDFTQADSTDVKKYAWSKIKGEDGKDGADGIAGKDGVGLKSTAITYAQSASGTVAPSSGWTVQVPTLVKGQYLWTKTVWTYTDNTNETGYTVSYNAKDGNNGQDGIAGKDGVGIKSTKIEYASSTSGTTKPGVGWSLTIPTVPNGQFLWTRTTWTYDDNTTEQGFSVAKMGDKGDKGDKGDPGNQGIPGAPGVDGKTPYTHYAYAWSADGTDRFTDTYPNENLVTTAMLSRGGTDISNITLTNGKYKITNAKSAWAVMRNVYPVLAKAGTGFITFSFKIKRIDGIIKGLGGHSAIFEKETQSVYVDGVENSIKNWNSTWISITDTLTHEIKVVTKIMQSVPSGTDTALYIQAGRQTNYADIYSAEIWDLKIEISDNSTIYTPAPADDFENAYPTYSGTYTDYTADDSQSPVDYVWSRILGNAGQDGSDGNGIASTAITYQASASGTTAPTGTWSTTIPSVAANQYLWTRTIISYTNNTSSTSYSVGKMGANGATGPSGPQGPQGPSGSNGISVSSVVEEYYVSTSPTSQAGGSWSTTVPNNADPNKYIWRRLKTTMSDSTVTYTNPALIQGMTGIYPYIGPTQPANPKEGQQWWKSDSSGNVTNFYVYKSGSWQGQTIQQSVLNIIALNAVTITGSTITGTTISGSTLNSAGTMQSGGATIQYSTKISGTTEITWQIPGTTQNGVIKLQPDGIYANSWNNAAKTEPLWGWSIDSAGLWVGTRGKKSNTSLPNTTRYGPDGISISNEDYKGLYGDVNLSYEDLVTIPETQLSPASGYSVYSTSGGSRPTARRNGRTVTLSGAFKNNAAYVSNTDWVTMGSVPVWARPSQNINFVVQGSQWNRFQIQITTAGLIQWCRYGYTSNTNTSAGSWLNISCVYTATGM